MLLILPLLPSRAYNRLYFVKTDRVGFSKCRIFSGHEAGKLIDVVTRQLFQIKMHTTKRVR